MILISVQAIFQEFWKGLNSYLLAWKDIESQGFLEGFRRLWNLTIEEVEVLFRKCNSNVRLQDVKKAYLTLQPNISFSFDSIKKAYFLNVWSFFFCVSKNYSDLYFRPHHLLANELLHEYAHYKFWQDNELPNKEKKEIENFYSDYSLESEIYSHSEEAKFLKKLRFVVPRWVDTTFFKVLSWESNGFLNCILEHQEIGLQNKIKRSFREVQESKRRLQKFTAVKTYTDQMSEQKTEKHSIFSSILKLDDEKKHFPVVKIELF